MRILVLCHEYPPIGGGAATAVSHVARSLVHQGHPVTVVTARLPDQPLRQLRDGVQIVSVPCQRRSRFSPSTRELLSFSWHARRQLPQVIRRFRPDGLLAFFAIPAGLIAVRNGKRFGLPVVVSLRGSDVPGFSQKRLGGRFQGLILPAIRKTLQQADSIAPNSEHLKQLALTFCPDIAGKMTIVRNGIEPDVIADTPAGSRGELMRLIQVGQLIERKRVNLTIEAVAAMRRRGIAACLTVVGEGPDMAVLRSQVERLELQDVVDFTGYCDRSKVLAMHREHDVYVSTSTAEGMSNAMIEAMACGLPVVTTAQGSHDVVEEAQCGKVVAIDDQAAITQALISMAQAPDARRHMGMAAIAFARSHTWDKTADAFCRLLLDGSDGP